eukprot:m.68392 g.68392  ORF g.68392 m.68392 type:complete len:117 (+) comp12194_c0_seq4:3250-3600(+)
MHCKHFSRWLKEYNKPPMQPNVAHVAFLIHSAEFVDLVVNANACNAVQYAQNHFGALYTLFPEGVQTLMGTLLQPPDAVKANIKLSHIFDDTLWYYMNDRKYIASSNSCDVNASLC